MVGARINDAPAMISRNLAEKISKALEDIAPGGQYCYNGFGYRFTEGKQRG